MTTSRTGIKRRCAGRGGYTFVEVLIAVVIFSAGMVGVFRTLLVSVDRMSLLTNRMYAHLILDNRISEMERSLRAYNSLPFELQPQEEVTVGGKTVIFKKSTDIRQLKDLNDIFAVTLSLTWRERGRDVSLSQSAYLANFKTDK
ncbi:MAG: prepilin-type N-terminal cleavage/methylation domain-containing protein [Candidatus Omnitrophica bacterium]|nr:prepilin-type N-terminal cleavage/methylation domain-containing protein [Candidatus Omnitrophota bacterium]